MQADVLLLLTWDNHLERGVLTGKLFEYIGASKPILSIGAINDDASRLITSNNFGVASNNPEVIYSFLKSIRKNEFKFGYEERYKFERAKQVVKLDEIFKASVQS